MGSSERAAKLSPPASPVPGCYHFIPDPHFMRIRRTLPIALAVVVVGAAVTLTVQLRKHAPPEPARLLPGADAFVYANLGWVRKANTGKPLFPVSHDPEYERFIEETGFDFERDLDAVAFAIHYPGTWPGGGTGGMAPEPRFSEVFIGRFDGSKGLAYLKRTAKYVENYNSVDIFTIPLYGRSFRVAILGVDTVAASNHDDPAVIHGMVDRSRRLASPFGGPALLRRYYKRVQLASPLWIVARVEPSAPAFWWMVHGIPQACRPGDFRQLQPAAFAAARRSAAPAGRGLGRKRPRCSQHHRQGEWVPGDVSPRRGVGRLARQRCRREGAFRQPAGAPGRESGRALCHTPDWSLSQAGGIAGNDTFAGNTASLVAARPTPLIAPRRRLQPNPMPSVLSERGSTQQVQ